MPKNSKQTSVNSRRTSESQEDEGTDDVLVSRLPEGYPQLAPPNALAKRHDRALLKDCSVNRRREIAKAYDGVDPRLKKVELFQAIFDTMMNMQECSVCGGNFGRVKPALAGFAGNNYR